jgi:hypothetical protein
MQKCSTAFGMMLNSLNERLELDMYGEREITYIPTHYMWYTVCKSTIRNMAMVEKIEIISKKFNTEYVLK